MKSLNGEEITVQLNGKDVKLSHTADLYYDVTPTSGNTIVIKNAGEGILSVTKLRTTGAGNKTNGTKLTATEETLKYVRSLKEMPAAKYTGDILSEDEAEKSTESVANAEEESEIVTEENETVIELEENEIQIENPEPEKEEETKEETQPAKSSSNDWSRYLSSFFGFFRR